MSGAAPDPLARHFLPAAPAVVAGHGRAAILTPDGELRLCPVAEAVALLRDLPPPLLVHAPATLRRLGLERVAAFDLLELYAFCLPARPAPPSPRGLALALDLDPLPPGLEAAASRLGAIAAALLARLAAGRDLPRNRDAAGLAARLGAAGWGWAPHVLAALGRPDAKPARESLQIWRRLPEWEDTATPPPPGDLAVAGGEARLRLAAILGPHAEQRPGQADYAAAAAAAFAPRERRGDPHLVLLEAGTGTGKTLGYLAPASLWAERNHGPVWISTFTRHLQRQIEAELARLFPDPAERRRRAVLRKGRENYLCLLNLEDAVNTVGAGPGVILLGLIARWAMASADGDLLGGDLPGWFGEVFGTGTLAPLADRRGECIHSACTHWRRCFVEHSIRRARHADIVVANHALVMAQAVWGGLDDAAVPTHYVFDEGHHLFDAADAAFAVRLSGAESAELRRWLLGPEGGRTRGRGLRARLADLLAEQPELEAPLEAALQAARGLAAPGWSGRLGMAPLDVGPANPMEALLALLHQQVLARRPGEGVLPAQGSIESDFEPPLQGLLPAAERLGRALGRLAEPLATLRGRLAARLDDAAAELDSAARNRIEALCRSLARRALDRLTAWQALLRDIAAPPAEPGSRPARITLLHLDRRDGIDRDIGLHQHWLDPTQPFAAALAAPAQGLLITSATLRDAGVAATAAWQAAEARTGAVHLPSPAIRAAVASPFDYARQTRAFIVNDLAPGDPAALAGAYRALFLAAGGGALGLFTAISRLRAVHARIAPALEAAGIPLLAQHVDAMDNATLVDLFRTEEESCLLGTDAMRDGVDVPGRALRLVVFERVPWPRPDILHRERRVHLSGGAPGEFDAGLARLRLRQAFGRLIRRESDRGVFVLLDRRTPSRLLAAFPPGVQPRRVGLAEAVAETAALLAPPARSGSE